MQFQQPFNTTYGQQGQQMSISDRDMATDLLLDSKALAWQSHLGIAESHNEPTAQLFQRLENDHNHHQRAIYRFMHQRGWYQPQ